MWQGPDVDTFVARPSSNQQADPASKSQVQPETDYGTGQESVYWSYVHARTL